MADVVDDAGNLVLDRKSKAINMDEATTDIFGETIEKQAAPAPILSASELAFAQSRGTVPMQEGPSPVIPMQEPSPLENIFESFLEPEAPVFPDGIPQGIPMPAPAAVIEAPKANVAVEFKTAVGTIRGKYVEYVDMPDKVILIFDPDEASHFTPAATMDSAVGMSGAGHEASVYFVGIEFIIPSRNMGIQVFIKE